MAKPYSRTRLIMSTKEIETYVIRAKTKRVG